MKTPAKSLALLAAVSALGALPASAAILALNPVADGYIRASQNAGQTNNLTNHIFLVGHTSATDDELRGVLSFDLNDPALAGATINSVTLTLYVQSTDDGSEAGLDTLNLAQLTESFVEGSVTWTSRDGTNNWTTAGGTSGSVLATATADSNTVVPGTPLIFSSIAGNALALSGGVLNLVVSVANPDSSRDIFRIASRTPLNTNNNPAADWVPVLTIDYTPAAIPEPSSFAALAGLGMLGFAAARRCARR